MASSRKLFFPIVFLVLLVVATEVAPTEARECETASGRFKGICVLKSNCANICMTEGFSGGKCGGARRRCMCTKQC